MRGAESETAVRAALPFYACRMGPVLALPPVPGRKNSRKKEIAALIQSLGRSA
jgi:hypothetical protein